MSSKNDCGSALAMSGGHNARWIQQHVKGLGCVVMAPDSHKLTIAIASGSLFSCMTLNSIVHIATMHLKGFEYGDVFLLGDLQHVTSWMA